MTEWRPPRPRHRRRQHAASGDHHVPRTGAPVAQNEKVDYAPRSPTARMDRRRPAFLAPASWRRQPWARRAPTRRRPPRALAPSRRRGLIATENTRQLLDVTYTDAPPPAPRSPPRRSRSSTSSAWAEHVNYIARNERRATRQRRTMRRSRPGVHQRRGWVCWNQMNLLNITPVTYRTRRRARAGASRSMDSITGLMVEPRHIPVTGVGRCGRT